MGTLTEPAPIQVPPVADGVETAVRKAPLSTTATKPQPGPLPDVNARRRTFGIWRLQHRTAMAAAGVTLPALLGVVIGLTLPRLPATASDALTVMALAAVVGLTAGIALCTRWAMLVAPSTAVVLFQTTRLVSGVHGPTVDTIRLDTTYGVVAFGLGFVVPALVGLLPMTVGASLGAALARRLAGSSDHRRRRAGVVWLYARRGIITFSALGLVALAVAIAQPASTPAVLGSDGAPLPGSIASLDSVPLGGHDQWIMIHAANPDKPVLLYLSGGPGQTDLAFTRAIWADLAQDFVVVDWDQRGAGKSYGALDPTSTLTPDQLVSDTIQLTNYLRQRFGAQKIYLTGESWGTTLGVLTVQRAPELYYAFIGSGQMVSQLETDRRLY